MNKRDSSFKRLMSYAGNHKVLSYLSMVISVLSAFAALVPLVLIYFILRDVITVAPEFSRATNVFMYGVWAVIASVLSMLIYIISLMCSHKCAFRIAANMRKQIIKHIKKLPINFSNDFGSGRVRQIVNESTQAAETYLAHNIPDMASAVATPIGMLILMFIYDWRFGLVSLIPIALAYWAMSKMLGPKMVEDMKLYNNALESMNNNAVEYVRGIPVVKTFGQTVHSFTRFKSNIIKYGKFCIDYTKSMRKPMVFYSLFINSTFAFLISFVLIIARGENISTNIVFNFIFYMILTPILTTTMAKVMFITEGKMTVKDALKRVDTLFAVKPLPDGDIETNPKDYTLRVNNVSFSYNKGENNNVLKNINLQVNQGELVALVGPSGGGKTTIAGLITRFWDVTNGQISIGGIDIRDIKKTNLMNLVSYVFQDSKLLKISILENVRLARPDATREEVTKALEKARCEDIIGKLPNGIDTVVGTEGVFLSEGECQRIAIARALLKESPILVFDEATAFADPENEVLVQKAFKELAKEKTVIMIAHRLSTIKTADKIYVIKNGEIQEEGKHNQLVKNGLTYSKMWEDYNKSISWKVGA